MEDGSDVNFGDPTFVEHFILPIDTMVPLPNKQDLQRPLYPVVVRPFLTVVLAGVEEYCLVRSLGIDAAGEP